MLITFLLLIQISIIIIVVVVAVVSGGVVVAAAAAAAASVVRRCNYFHADRGCFSKLGLRKLKSANTNHDGTANALL